jgi:hypothetical protein
LSYDHWNGGAATTAASKDYQKLQEAINLGIEIVDPEPGPFSALDHICERILDISSYSREFDSLRSSKGVQKTRLVLRNLMQKGQSSPDSFRTLMDEQINALKKDRAQKFTVAFPLSFGFPTLKQSETWPIRTTRESQAREVRLLDPAEFYSDYIQRLNRSERDKIGLTQDVEGQVIGSQILDMKVCMVESFARDAYFAFQDAWRVARLWASIVIFLEASRIIMRFPMPPLAGMRIPEFGMVFDDKRDYVDLPTGSFPILSEQAPLARDPNQLRKSFDFIASLPPLKILDVIHQAFVAYAEAVSEPDPNYAFLKFWLGLELMGRLRPGHIAEDKIIARITSTFPDKPPTFESRLKSVLDKRNRLLHQGDFEIVGLHDLLFAKSLYQSLLKTLVCLCREGHDIGWIETLWTHADKSPEELSEAASALEYLKKKSEPASQSTEKEQKPPQLACGGYCFSSSKDQKERAQTT